MSSFGEEPNLAEQSRNEGLPRFGGGTNFLSTQVVETARDLKS